MQQIITCQYIPNLKLCEKHAISILRHATDRCSVTSCSKMTEWVGMRIIKELGRPIYLGLCCDHIIGEDMINFSRNVSRDNTGKYCRINSCTYVASIAINGVKIFCRRHKYVHCDPPIKRVVRRKKSTKLNLSQRKLIHQIKLSAEFIHKLKIAFIKN